MADTETTTVAKNLTDDFTRTSVAVKKDVAPLIGDMVKATGARSLSQLITVLVRRKDAAVAALAPIVADYQREVKESGGDKSVRKELQQKLKGMSTEEIARLMTLATQVPAVATSE